MSRGQAFCQSPRSTEYELEYPREWGVSTTASFQTAHGICVDTDSVVPRQFQHQKGIASGGGDDENVRIPDGAFTIITVSLVRVIRPRLYNVHQFRVHAEQVGPRVRVCHAAVWV